MKRKSLIQQVCDVLQSKLMLEGIDKHSHKRSINKELIVSSTTYQTYRRECIYFIKWVKRTYPNNAINTLEKYRPYAADYILTARKANGDEYSAWTLKARRAALAKLYGTTCKDICDTPIRQRCNIKRSRYASSMDTSYNKENHPDVELLGRAAGLRRADFSRVHPKDFHFDEQGNLFVFIDKGKGGKSRDAMVDPDYKDNVLNLIKDTHPDQRVIPLGSIPAKMDQHANRRAYVLAMLARFSRPINDIPKAERYICRKDAKGTILDRKAMERVSLYLGHGSIDRKTGDYIPRVNVIASNYIL